MSTLFKLQLDSTLVLFLKRLLAFLTCASLGHRLSGDVSHSDRGHHHAVQGARSQGLEAEAADVGHDALILDDAAVVNQQDLVGVQISGSRCPPRLQTVGAAEVGEPQPTDLSRS